MTLHFRTALFFFSIFGSLAFAQLPDLPATKQEDTAQVPDEEEVDGDGEPIPNRQPSPGVGKEMQKFGESVAARIDRMVKKKGFRLWGDPWTMQGIPIIFPSSANGFHLGLRVALQNIKRQDPHLMEVEAQVLASDKGRYKHSLKLDFPHAFDGKFRITTRLAYDRDISIRYFGVGNETTVDRSALENDNPLYQYVRAGPSFTFQLFRYLGRNFRFGPVIGLRWLDISTSTGSLLFNQRPHGITGGKTHYIGLAIIHDTLDFEPYPSRGAIQELFFQGYGPYSGSDYTFLRATYTYRRYQLLHRRLILAHRTLFEVLHGSPPFYELGAVGGMSPALTFGGDRFLRGYDGNRFVDNIKLALGFELRWDPVFFNFAKQDLTLGFVPFFDIGRVWPTALPLRLGTWHASTGWGARLIWNSRFIMRLDFALNQEGTAIYVNLGNSF